MSLGKKNPFTEKRSKSELQIQKEIMEYLSTLDGLFWRNNTTGMFDPITKRYRANSSINGVSDILGIYRGIFVAIEVKTTKGRLSANQQEFLNQVALNRGLSFVARSVDDVKDEFMAFGLDI